MNYRVAFYAATVALAISLALHARGALRDETRATPAPPVCEPELPHSSGVGGRANGEGGGDGEASCRKQLAECKREGWELVKRAIAGGAQGHPKSPRPGPDPAQLDAGADDPQARQLALCRIAQQQLEAIWKLHQEPIEGIIRNAATEQWSEEWLDHKMDTLQEEWDLSEGQQEQLEHGYDSLWRHHGPRMRRLLESDNVDYDAMIRATQEFFKEEDLLYAQVLGESGRQRYSASEVEKRTGLMAMLATFAGQPWNKSIDW